VRDTTPERQSQRSFNSLRHKTHHILREAEINAQPRASGSDPRRRLNGYDMDRSVQADILGLRGPAAVEIL
jgi:hypothetical protein